MQADVIRRKFEALGPGQLASPSVRDVAAASKNAGLSSRKARLDGRNQWSAGGNGLMLKVRFGNL